MLAARSLRCTRCCRATAMAPRRFSLKAFWSAPPAPPSSHPPPAGPSRPTKLEVQQQQERAASLAREHESLLEADDVGQVDGRPARNIAVHLDGHARVFDTAFLRDSCTCAQCVDPHSRQKLFQTADIPPDLQASYTAVADEHGAGIELAWTRDVPGYGPTHRTRHSLAWLQRALDAEVDLRGGVRHDDGVLWDRRALAADNPWVDYGAYMARDEVLFAALTRLRTHGLLFVGNVPDSEQAVAALAGRIGPLKDTFYGRTWDVRSRPRAENIAYTPRFLGLHMDLLYTANPPHLQLLHSLRARTPGGESFFSDAFHAAAQLQRTSPGHFRTLCSFPVTYHYHHPAHHYHATRPVLDLFPAPHCSDPANTAVRRVNWSPPFQAPFEARIGSNHHPSLRAFIHAARAFDALLSAPDNIFEHRLNEGECVIFDNRRVLHARRAFDPTKGERWLKGAYVDDDVFFSKLRCLDERFNRRWTADGVVRHV